MRTSDTQAVDAAAPRRPSAALVAGDHRHPPIGETLTPLDRWTGPLMFWAAMFFLVLLAGLICANSLATALHMPEAAAAAEPLAGMMSPFPLPEELSAGEENLPAGDAAGTADAWPLDRELQLTRPFFWTLTLLQAVFVCEAIAHGVNGGRHLRPHWLYCLLPPFRLGGRDHISGTAIWLPRIGWAWVDHHLRTRIERAFSVPMILIGLAVLPLLGFEWYLHSKSLQPTWRMLVFLHVSQSIIWLAFALEFVILVSIAKKKLRYCREHWIDIAIICLPLVSFLRVLRFGRLLRLHHVAKVGRVYRMRGLGMRMFRGVLVLDLVRFYLEGDPEKRLAALREQLEERELEVANLRDQITKLENEAAQQRKQAC